MKMYIITNKTASSTSHYASGLKEDHLISITSPTTPWKPHIIDNDDVFDLIYNSNYENDYTNGDQYLINDSDNDDDKYNEDEEKIGDWIF